MLEDPGFGGHQTNAVVGRHHHQHRGAEAFGIFGAVDHHLGGEMRDGDDHRHPARDMLEADPGEQRALFIGEHELLGVVGEDADRIDALVDHAIEHPAHALFIDAAIGVKRGGGDGQNAGERLGKGHGVMSS